MIENLKKIELHVHLDGSVRMKTASELLHKNMDETKQFMQANHCESLSDYLKTFDIPIQLMQDKNTLERVSYELVEDLKKDNAIYAEIRFAPQFHTSILTYEAVIESVLKGIQQGNIKVNLILCCMRGENTKIANEKTIEMAYQYLHKGVCGIDLAGDEAHYPNHMYQYIFEKCKKLNIPYTIHSGEASGVESIREAISYGTSRIGHGIRAIESDEVIHQMIENNIVLEVCPTSNIDTKVISNIENHPIDKLYKKGVKITINTDNRTVSNTTLNKEYQLLYETFHFTKEDFIQFNKNSIEASFLSEEEKQKLLMDIEK